ncbi:MAG: hypothetical protein CSA66_03385 [Proteobacteria bacterium]|nr:MAG: hypothetical protein CSA66_03385 [Pseudomonadota bacterium]
MTHLRLALVALTFVVAACDPDDVSPDGDTSVAVDTSAVADTVVEDTVADTAADTSVAEDAVADTVADTSEAQDTAVADTGGTPGVTDTPFGPIEGEACGTLTAALTSDDPSFHVTTWTFTADTFDSSLLDPGAARLFDSPNAGGSSKCGETMSVQWLAECEGATLDKLETEIDYDTEGSITDYAVTVAGLGYGVSVTRAYLGPFNTDYDLAAAKSLLSDKLAGVNESTLNVSAADAWSKQILHVWTLQRSWVPILEEAWAGLADTLKSDTVVLVTVEAGSDAIVTDSCDD